MNSHQTESSITLAVNELLEERQQLLTVFCQTAGLSTQGSWLAASNQFAVLKRLCQLLMDYYALWQFEIHDRLLQQDNHQPQAVGELGKASESLEESRTIAVAFNDKYDQEDHELQLEHLEYDLFLLGEEIAKQIDIENRIIRAMNSSHK